MTTEKKLGKITYIHFGACGYQEAMLGLRIQLGGDGWGVGTDKAGAWTTTISESTKWTHEDRIRGLGEMCWEVHQLLIDAKVESVDKLLNKPVECDFEGGLLKSWRILKEVL